jgi:hypothetical protein
MRCVQFVGTFKSSAYLNITIIHNTMIIFKDLVKSCVYFIGAFQNTNTYYIKPVAQNLHEQNWVRDTINPVDTNSLTTIIR